MYVSKYLCIYVSMYVYMYVAEAATGGVLWKGVLKNDGKKTCTGDISLIKLKNIFTENIRASAFVLVKP